MNEFTHSALTASVILEMKAENNKKFDVIRKRIEKRTISLATPKELITMIDLVRQNDALTKKLDPILKKMSARWADPESV